MAVFIFAGCKKDKEGPVIHIESPLSSETYVNGDTIHIHGDVEDNEEMAEVMVELRNGSQSDTLLFSTGGATTDNPYHFHGTYIVDVPMHSDLELEVSATDVAGNNSTEYVHLHIMQ